MSNELIPGMPNLPGTPANMTYIKENKPQTFNIENSKVDFNIHLPQNETMGSAEQMIAIQRFSKEYYQLLVTCEEDVFTTNVITISADRALVQCSVPSEIYERCSTLSDAGIEELKTIPAIICQENTKLRGEADPAQWAMYGYIRRIQKAGRNIKIAFHPIAAFPQSKLCEKSNAVYFDLNMDCAITDLNRSAWTVHKTNLFEAFDEAGLSHLPRPY